MECVNMIQDITFLHEIYAIFAAQITIYTTMDIKLLLVEDDPNLAYIIRSGLEDMVGGYEVTTASNGAEGLKAWEANKPDIIVSDIDMPVMDGFEMVRHIRETDGYQKTFRTRRTGRAHPCHHENEYGR